jgi:hypothetical protein
MKFRTALALLALIASSTVAARKPCDELKAEIDTKIRANGVPEFSLDVVDQSVAEQSAGKIVGQCDGGSKRIVYLRGSASGAAVEQVAKK